MRMNVKSRNRGIVGWCPAAPRRGLALVMTLWLTVVLVALVYALLYDVQIEMRLRRLSEDDMRARWLAHAGVGRAIADLSNDMVIERSEDNTPCDARGDVWAIDEDGDKTGVVLGDEPRRQRDREERDPGSFTVRVIDGESRINLNNATANLLKSLFIVLGEDDPFVAQRRAEAIIDWRDRNTTPVATDAEPGLTETQWWETISEQEFDGSWTGVMHNSRFLTVDELLDLPGMTRDLFEGAPEDEQTRSHHREARSRRGGGEALHLRDCVTTLSNGQININTAPREVLGAMILTAIGQDGAWEEIADAIIERRDGRNLEDKDDDTPFVDPSEIQSVPGASGLINQTEDYQIATRSETFIINATGDVGTVHRSVVCEARRAWEVFIDPNVGYRPEGFVDPTRGGQVPGDGETGPQQRPAVRILSWMEN